MERVLVTGGTGVTGNALVRCLLRQHVKVTALVRPGSFRRRYLPAEDPGLELVDCGMEQYETLRLPESRYDAFFHLAWDGSTGKEKVENRNNCPLQTKNILYALQAVELCRRLACPVFLMTGSQAQFGRMTKPVRETDLRSPVNAYGMAKQCAEGMTRLLCRDYGIRHVWPILFSVYGPNDATESLVDKTVRGLLRGETLPYTEGRQMWEYLYSWDAARALILLAEKGRDGEAYNVGPGAQRPLSAYIREMFEVLAPALEPRLGEVPYSPQSTMFLGADTAKLREETGFVPSWPFGEGIRAVAEAVKRE